MKKLWFLIPTWDAIWNTFLLFVGAMLFTCLLWISILAVSMPVQ